MLSEENRRNKINEIISGIAYSMAEVVKEFIERYDMEMPEEEFNNWKDYFISQIVNEMNNGENKQFRIDLYVKIAHSLMGNDIFYSVMNKLKAEKNYTVKNIFDTINQTLSIRIDREYWVHVGSYCEGFMKGYFHILNMPLVGGY